MNTERTITLNKNEDNTNRLEKFYETPWGTSYITVEDNAYTVMQFNTSAPVKDQLYDVYDRKSGEAIAKQITFDELVDTVVPEEERDLLNN